MGIVCINNNLSITAILKDLYLLGGERVAGVFINCGKNIVVNNSCLN